MILICAWCRTYGKLTGPPGDARPEWYICPDCDAMLRKKYRLIYPAALDVDALKKNVLVIPDPP